MRLLHNETGKKISLPYKMKAEEKLSVYSGTKDELSDKQEIEGKLYCEEVTDLTNIVENDCIKIIDYDRIETDVQLRCRKPGDFYIWCRI